MHFAFSRTALSPRPHLVTTAQKPPSTLESILTHNSMMTCRPQAHSGNACAPQGDPNNRASVRRFGSHPLFSSFFSKNSWCNFTDGFAQAALYLLSTPWKRQAQHENMKLLTANLCLICCPSQVRGTPRRRFILSGVTSNTCSRVQASHKSLGVWPLAHSTNFLTMCFRTYPEFLSSLSSVPWPNFFGNSARNSATR